MLKLAYQNIYTIYYYHDYEKKQDKKNHQTLISICLDS